MMNLEGDSERRKLLVRLEPAKAPLGFEHRWCGPAQSHAGRAPALHVVGDGPIGCEIGRYEDRIGTQAFRSYCWHGRMHTEAPGLLRCSVDHRAIAPPCNDQGLAAGLRHHPARKSVVYFGAVRLRDGKFIFARELPGEILPTGRQRRDSGTFELSAT